MNDAGRASPPGTAARSSTHWTSGTVVVVTVVAWFVDGAVPGVRVVELPLEVGGDIVGVPASAPRQPVMAVVVRWRCDSDGDGGFDLFRLHGECDRWR